MTTLPKPEFDDTKLLPILAFFWREFIKDLRELLHSL